jgi:hypothetical protein
MHPGNLKWGKALIMICIYLTFMPGLAQVIPDKVYKESIRTVQLHREGWELTYPIMGLTSEDRLVLNFDDLSAGKVSDYSYTVIHCNAFWEPSSIPPEDYIDGFIINHISSFSNSFNTFQAYVNYNLVIPNEDISLKLSGNYILRVFENFNEDSVVMTKRFVVTENLVSVGAVVKRPILGMFRDNGQEVDVTVDLGSFPVMDPFSEVNLTICQNNRWDLAIYDLKPLFIRDNLLVYDYQKENIFPGGNEFRYADLKSVRYLSEAISSIEYIYPFFHIFLYPGLPRTGRNYFFHDDLNGRFFIDVQEGVKKDVEADYVLVHFTLPYEAPLTDGDVYVFGAFSDWNVGERNKMVYNLETKAYETIIPLKQGYYNYEYVYVHTDTGYHDSPFLEGSYYETENDYVIYFYYQDRIKRYDRVIGHQIVNSVRK